MCRDGYRVPCANGHCAGEVTCRDYTLCIDCREGTEQEWW